MKVKIISHTFMPEDLLLYTKDTRLTQGEETRAKIAAMTPEEKLAGLEYMANTIPSSWEFVSYTFEITGVSRAFTHQFVRTRTGTFAQQTMRMLPMEKFKYVTGCSIEKYPEAKRMYDVGMSHIQSTYNILLKMGIPAEDARGILPTNICTNIIAQFNLRTLSDLCKSRTGGRTQGEYREVMNAIAMAVLEVHPWTEKFLFPDMAKRVTALEQILADNITDKDQHAAALKIIDQIKKKL